MTEMWTIQSRYHSRPVQGPFFTLEEAAARLRLMSNRFYITRHEFSDEAALQELERQARTPS